MPRCTPLILLAILVCGLSAVETASLACPNQALDAVVGRAGLDLISTTGGDRTVAIRITGLGRDQLAAVGPGTVASQDGVTRLQRPDVSEEFTVSLHGIRQDFLVHRRPDGAGPLTLALAVEGAAASGSGDQLSLRLDSGRELTWHSLLVLDRSGAAVPATWTVADVGRVEIRVEDREAAYPLRIDPTFSDADWAGFGPRNGVGFIGSVNAVASFGGDLIVGGQFTKLGSTTINNLARWDGDTWTALGGGTNTTVNALLVDGGDLYAAGAFTTAGGVPAGRVARWNGTAWSAVGPTTATGSVNALAKIGGVLYAGGAFTTLGGVAASRLAAWDGTTWSPLSTGANNTVNALAVQGSALIAGGTFTTVGGTAALAIASWNGTAWSALGSGGNGNVNALAVDGANLYATGAFSDMGGVVANRVARWNGTAWSAMGSGLPTAGNGNALVIANGQVVAGGLDQVHRANVWSWNGSAWSSLADGPYPLASSVSRVTSLCLHEGRIVAGSLRGVSLWDGVRWTTPLPGGSDGEVLDLYTAGSSTFAAGTFSTLGGTIVSGIARWDGSRFNPVGDGIECSEVASDGTSIYVLTGSSSIRRWDGSAWINFASADNNIQDLRFHAGELYVAGSFSAIDGVPVNRIARWNGTAWSALGTGLNDVARTIHSAGGSLYVGGDFTTAGGTAAARVARWDGSAWSALGAGVSNAVYDLAMIGSTLYAATGATGGIRAWDGTAWSTPGGGLSGFTQALAVSGTTLFAAGDLTQAGGLPVNRIAAWDGTAWTAVGSGADARVNALAVTANNTLLVGGQFDSAGGKASATIALLDLNGNSATPGTPSDIDPAANIVATDAPPRSATGVRFAASDADGTPVTWTLSNDAGGRFAIDATGLVTSTSALSSGSFTITVQAGDGVHTSATATATIIVDSAPTVPTDSSAATNQVATNAANGTAVGITLLSTDPDATTPTYALTANAGGRFAVNATTGVVTVAGALAPPGNYTITARSWDGLLNSATVDFTILVDRAPTVPTDSDAAANAIVENALVGTAVRVTAQASDADGTALTYSLSSNAGGRFAIAPSTGVVTVAAALGGPASHSITVVASDGFLSASASFTIAVVANTAPPAPIDIDAAANSVGTAATVGTPARITARSADADPGATVTYSLTDSAGGRFAIDAATGVVTVATVPGATGTHTIVVRASDGLLNASAPFTITAEDVATPPAASSGGGGGGGCGGGAVALLCLAAMMLGLRRRR